MHTTLNARAMATATVANLNTSLVDMNRYRAALAESDALAIAIKGMQERGEMDIAKTLYAEFCQTRTDANNIARRIGAEEV